MSSRRTAQRLNRILAMLPWVIAHPGATVEEVCGRFGYTRSELVADLDLVFVCGLPGYGPGDLMVAYVDDDEVIVELADYFAQPVRLSPHEALGLLAAGMALVSTGEAPDALATAVTKLQSVVMPDAGDGLVVDLAEPEFVGVLRDAARDSSVVRITHTAISSGVTSERAIEPWSVFATMGNWYVRAWCRAADAERVFRVDRIRSVELTTESFTPPDEPPPPVVRYTPGEEDVRAVIRLDRRSQWVVDYYPVEIIDETPAGTTVRFSTNDPKVAARLLLRLGDTAELVEGPEVSAALETLRKEILQRYDHAE
jgi:proteasome accessory factor C